MHGCQVRLVPLLSFWEDKMDWATQGRTTASIGAARRREDRLGKIPPQPSLFDQRNRGTPRNIQDRSRTHFKDLSTQHPGVPYFADLAVKEKAYWDSGVWIPDAGLKQDTSIEETLFALTGVPALARLGVSGARAAVGSGRQALANRGIGGWTKVHAGSASARSRVIDRTLDLRYKNMNIPTEYIKRLKAYVTRPDVVRIHRGRTYDAKGTNPTFTERYTTSGTSKGGPKKSETSVSLLNREFEKLREASIEKTKTHLTGRVTDRQMDDLDLWTKALENVRRNRNRR